MTVISGGMLYFFTAQNGRSTDVLAPGTAKIKLKVMMLLVVISFSPLVIIHSYTPGHYS